MDLININQHNPIDLFKEGGIQPVIDRIRETVSGEVPDVSTKKGRDRIASLAHQVAKSKTALDKAGKDLADRLNAQLKPINAQRKLARDELDKLKEEVRRPLSEWEEAEKQRQEAHIRGIERMISLAKADVDGQQKTAAQLANDLADLEKVELGDAWEEFSAQAAEQKDRSLKALRANLSERQKYEDDQAELARLRREREEREELERVQLQEREREERERAAAEAAAEAARKQAEDKAKAEIEAAEAARKKAEDEKVQAEIRAAEAAESARMAEIARQQEAARKDLEAKEKRERNRKHVKSVNDSVMNALKACGCDDDTAASVLQKLREGGIPHVTLTY